jgi:hypothetical protein
MSKQQKISFMILQAPAIEITKNPTGHVQSDVQGNGKRKSYWETSYMRKVPPYLKNLISLPKKANSRLFQFDKVKGNIILLGNYFEEIKHRQSALLAASAITSSN